jgi:hypothetical protein
MESDREHPARPEQPGDAGFAEGQADLPHEEVEPNFARGQSMVPPDAEPGHGRFSEGQEELPETPEKEDEGRFSAGQEESPTSD